MDQSIINIFNSIPVSQILEIAHQTQRQIISDPTLVKMKSERQAVTQADFEIQQLLLTYFSNSELSGKYTIKAEEELTAKDLLLNSASKPWQLIIDPLDGTSAFCRGEPTWGCMVGLCDRHGKIVYSWNLLSSGEIFSSWDKTESSKPILQNNQSDLSTLKTIDFYDYGAGLSKFFTSKLENVSKGSYKAASINTTSIPAAIWAGWSLIQQSIDALIWLPSTLGKGIYPEYDLIFLGALPSRGWKIALGKSNSAVHIVCIAKTEKTLKTLWDVGLELVDPSRNLNFSYETEVEITNPI